jgi:alpha-tubulin suppressor-like RCC1 family protein
LVSGGVECWGFNANGAVGDGTITTRYTPVNVRGLTQNVTQIAVGQNFACALINDGSAKCWGFNYFGQLGNGQAGHHPTPISVFLYSYYFPFFPVH